MMWAIALAMYFGCKWLTWRRTPVADVPAWKHVAYLLCWVGMDPAAFLRHRDANDVKNPSGTEWLLAAAKTAVGLTDTVRRDREHHVLAPVARRLGGADRPRADVALRCVSFIVVRLATIRCRRTPAHALACVATSESDFWSRRWNTAFHDLCYRFVFRPLNRRIGHRWGTLAGFTVSGLVHDVVISVPAGAGFGMPTMYFVVQGGALLFERSRPGRKLGLGRGIARLVVYRNGAAGAGRLAIPHTIHRAGGPADASSMEDHLMNELLPKAILFAGVGQLSVLVGSSLVPIRLHWREAFRSVPHLQRQMVWVYGGYTVMSIVALGMIARVQRPGASQWLAARPQRLLVRHGVLGRAAGAGGRARRQRASYHLVAHCRLLVPGRVVHLLHDRFRLGNVSSGKLECVTTGHEC